MKRYTSFGLSLVVALAVLGCGSDADDENAQILEGEAVSIKSTQDAKNVVASLSNLTSQTNSNSYFGNTRSLQHGSVQSSQSGFTRSMIQSRESYSQECTNGGTLAVNGEMDDTTVDQSITYTHCDLGGMLQNGSFSMKGTNNSSQIDLVIDFDNYSVIDSYSSVFMDMQQSFKGYYDENAYGFEDFEMIISGSMDLISDQEELSFTYEKYTYSVEDQKIRIDGKTSISSNINSCINGVYTIETLEPLSSDWDYFTYSQGKMKVNDTLIEYNDNATITVTLEDGSTEVIDQNQDIVCQ